jgi:uncharacterized Zn finger protein
MGKLLKGAESLDMEGKCPECGGEYTLYEGLTLDPESDIFGTIAVMIRCEKCGWIGVEEWILRYQKTITIKSGGGE